MTSDDDGVRVITAEGSQRHYWRDLWRHRELLVILAKKDLLVRYKETAIGVTWVLLRPALTLLVFTLIFGKIAKLPSDDVPYSIMVFAGLLPWLFFASSVSGSSESLISNANLLTKVYFPRMIVPGSAVLANLVDALVTGLLLVALMMFYGIRPDLRILVLPLFVALLCTLTIGVRLWVAALSVKYRDFRYVTPFAVQLGLYASPVAYSSSVIPDQWRLFFYLNPMAGVIDGFRWTLLGSTAGVHVAGVVFSAVLASLLLATGVVFFRRTERGLADTL